MKRTRIRFAVLLALLVTGMTAVHSQDIPDKEKRQSTGHNEKPDQPYKARIQGVKPVPPAASPKSTGFFTVQVNVDNLGNNIPMDAANEPSIAVDPTDPNKMVIGWREFSTVTSNFRQAGWAYTSDGGQHWTFPGVIEPGVFRSDPVLEADASGTFYYNSLTSNSGMYTCKVFKSTDGGASWDAGTEAHGGDKQWMIIDHSESVGKDNIYAFWTQYYSSCNPEEFTRSTDHGATYENCVNVAYYPYWGTLATGPDGELYVAGNWGSDGIAVSMSTNAKVPGSVIGWDLATVANVDGYMISQIPINPVGLLGQAYVGVDRSDGPGRGNVYVLASVARISVSDPGDVMFARSTDGWLTWEPPVRINTDTSTTNYQWLATMSVAPNGRIDVAWLDTRLAPAGGFNSALYYSYSNDQGETWSVNKRISETFDPQLGYPQQSKMGDYFHMISDNAGAHLAWANTLNGEEDVWYTHLIPNGVGLDEQSERKEVSLNACPNPFRSQARISFTIGEQTHVKLEILDLSGRCVAVLADRDETAGSHSVTLGSERISDGFYFCRLTAGSEFRTIRLVKTK